MEARSTDVQNNFGTYLKLTQFEDIFITRNGRKVAVLTLDAWAKNGACETFIAPFDITVQTASHTSILQPMSS